MVQVRSDSISWKRKETDHLPRPFTDVSTTPRANDGETNLDPAHPLRHGIFIEVTGDENTFVVQADVLGVDDRALPEIGGSIIPI